MKLGNSGKGLFIFSWRGIQINNDTDEIMSSLEENEKDIEYFFGEVSHLWGCEETQIEVIVSGRPGMH